MKTKSSQYLVPYIDFAFMVVITLIGLLSIAYFTPPGKEDLKDTGKIEENKIQPIEDISEKAEIYLPVSEKVSKEKQGKDSKINEKTRISEKEVEELKKELKEKEENIKLLEEKIKMLEEELKKTKGVALTPLQYPGKHEFTDLAGD